ncbi:MAG: hypothetical protein AAF840_03130 [Bacteroidota bacterium]
MNLSQDRQSSLFLILGSLLMFVTMILHPVGGDFRRLLAVSQMAMIAHGIAIFSIPFTALGFIGLSQRLGLAEFSNRLGLAFGLVALLAALLAATANGFILPFFIEGYADAPPETIEAIQPILRYNFKVNHAFDYQLIFGMFLSMFFWSLSILQTKKLSRWTAYLGLVLALMVVGALIGGFYFLDLSGFRYFVFGWLAWIVAVAWGLWSTHNTSSE